MRLFQGAWWRLRRDLITIATLDSSPPKIAFGVGVGMFVGMLPITGFQFLTGLLLSFLLRVNKLAVVLSTQVLCNGITLPFLFFFNLKVGERVLAYEQPSVSLSVFRVLIQQASFRNFLEIFLNIARPLYLGSLLVAPCVGALGCFLALVAIKSHRRRRLGAGDGS